MQISHYKHYRVLSLLVLGLLVSACQPAEQILAKPTLIDTYTLPTIDNQVLREFNGVSRAQDLTRLSFRVEGRIAQIPVSKGQEIKQGQVLAVLEKRDYQITLEDRKARMEVAEKQAKRVKQLVDQKLMAQAEFDQINAQYLVAKAQAKQAELTLQYTVLRAPFDGMVSDVFLESFENVQPGVAVLSVQKVDQIEVDIQMPDTLIAVAYRGKEEGSLKVQFEAFEGQYFDGHLLEVNTEKDPKTSTYIATIVVDLDPSFKVLEGMPAKVSINLSNITYTYNREYLLPINAVVMKDGDDLVKQESGVWLYDAASQTVKYQAVRLGVIVGDQIEVVEGLKDGQTIVTVGASRLLEGQHVELVKG
ncbi:efflux RND transporter periplasmic adaptor subunit [Shewanella sp. ULN5]|uniref:efflux RND transporter periplasmic adaptor subunit n=1 Tax=Shewanella sp. ULN5 TaxID=2994678 RepID=UPI00273FE290|nr:efflux RND transporter periplasmic adaptor subunit [Shewanella sp. ULN5]MDP5145706.1 efflux RND transporter periplasmic adaptor subunit [Shewanella sp. ULN5]